MVLAKNRKIFSQESTSKNKNKNVCSMVCMVWSDGTWVLWVESIVWPFFGGGVVGGKEIIGERERR